MPLSRTDRFLREAIRRKASAFHDGPVVTGHPAERNMNEHVAQAELEQRVVELETRLAFQEQTLSELNEALSETRLEAAAQTALLRRLIEDIKLTRGDFGGDAASEPPPPHY